MPTHYPNTNKAIYSINELIYDIVISQEHFCAYNMICRLLLEIIITGYPKVW